MKGDLGIIEIHHSKSQGAEVKGRGENDVFKKMKDVSWKHNINTTLTLWGNSRMLAGLRDLNLNVYDFLLSARDVTVSVPAGILVLQMANVKSWSILAERHWFGVACTCSGWDNTQDACWEAHGLTTEMDNDSSLSGLSLCEAAWQSTVLTAPWRDANTARSEWRCWWAFGIYSIGLWCAFKAARFTGLGLGWSLDEAHAAPGWGWDPLDTYAFLWSTTMEHTVCTQPTWPCLINGFEGRLHPFLCFHHMTKCFILWLFTHFCLVLYSI